MNEPLNDELVSAYLDGELTAEEQARAERLLAENPQARRLHAELQAMRSCLQGVSPQQLSDDFSGRVLRAAEQRMLAEPKSNPGASETKREHAPWQERIRRPLAYALIVLAASVLVAVFVPDTQKQNEQPVAHAPATQATPAEPPSMTSTLGLQPDVDNFDKAQMPTPMAREDFGDQVKLNELADLDGSLLVVTCEITPDAARNDAFRQVLVKNQIELGQAEGERESRGSGKPSPREFTPSLQMSKKTAGPESGLEMVYVEATKEQLEATLTEISKKKDDFLSVDVGPTESQVPQNRWQRDYNRGRGNLVQQQRVQLQAEHDTAGTAPTNPTAAAGATAPTTEAKQPGGNVGQVGGRARGFSMPAPDGRATQSGKALAGEQVDRTAPIAKGGAGFGKDGTNAAVEPGTLRALFVLRVAEDQKSATEPAKPAAPRP